MISASHKATWLLPKEGRNTMKKIAVVSVFAGTLALILSGCHFAGSGVRGSGVLKTEKRDFAPFKSIESDGAYEIEVNCQKPFSVEIEGDDNVLPLIKTEVRDGVLYIKSPQPYSTRQPVTLRIAV